MPHIKLRFSSQSGHPDLLYSQEWVNVIFLHLWPQKLYRAFRFGTLWPISCSYPRHSQLTRHSLMLANGRIRQSLTALVFLTKTTVYHGWKFSVSRRNSVMAVLSGTIPVIRAESLRKVLGYNRGVGGLAVGLQSRLALGLWLVKYWAVHKGCKQTLPAFN